MINNRKKWIQPQLIVLGRGAPEENVLANCKSTLVTASGGTNKKCSRGATCGTKCNARGVT